MDKFKALENSAKIENDANMIDRQIALGLSSAEKKCVKPPRAAWLKKLQFARIEVSHYKTCKAALTSKISLREKMRKIEKETGRPMEKPTSKKGLNKKIRKAIVKLRQTRRAAAEARKKFSQELNKGHPREGQKTENTHCKQQRSLTEKSDQQAAGKI